MLNASVTEISEDNLTVESGDSVNSDPATGVELPKGGENPVTAICSA